MLLAAYLTFLTLLILLISLIAIFILLLAVYPVKVAAGFNSGQAEYMNIVISWLNSFLKGFVTSHDGSTTITVFLFNRKVFEKYLNNEKGRFFNRIRTNYMNYINMAEALSIKNTKLYASYGFTDPAVTGMVCGAVGIVSQYINIDELYNNADFMADFNYFNIKAEAEINGVVTFMRIISRNMIYRKPRLLGNR